VRHLAEDSPNPLRFVSQVTVLDSLDVQGFSVVKPCHIAQPTAKNAYRSEDRAFSTIDIS
jgi:hypothetical protein